MPATPGRSCLATNAKCGHVGHVGHLRDVMRFFTWPGLIQVDTFARLSRFLYTTHAKRRGYEKVANMANMAKVTHMTHMTNHHAHPSVSSAGRYHTQCIEPFS